jgi:hypothetical protein
MKEPIKISLLPTEDGTTIGYHFDTNPKGSIDYAPNFGFKVFNTEGNFQHKPQHVHITVSNEVGPIKEGDWMIRGDEQPTKVTPDFYWDYGVAYRQIVATTDPKLTIKTSRNEKIVNPGVYEKPLPQIPQSFLKEFVANPGGDYVVEYEIQVKANTGISQYENWTTVSSLLACGLTGVERKNILKLNKDNEVNITAVKKKMYTRDEMVSAYDEGETAGCQHGLGRNPRLSKSDWIKYNL